MLRCVIQGSGEGVDGFWKTHWGFYDILRRITLIPIQLYTIVKKPI